jgi:hypothetical protein
MFHHRKHFGQYVGLKVVLVVRDDEPALLSISKYRRLEI